MRMGTPLGQIRYRLPAMVAVMIVPVLLTGCHVDMWTQPKVHKPLQESDFFSDKSSARMPVAGTVAHRDNVNELKVGNVFYTGIGADGKFIDELPKEVVFNKETLFRGKERFEIFCTPCHGQVGDGKGMIAIRGLALRKQPGNYHLPRLRKAPLGHFFDVISNGFGVMYSYGSRIETADRWKIAAYIRVLQASQNVTGAEIPLEKVKMGAGAENETTHESSEHGLPKTEGEGR